MRILVDIGHPAHVHYFRNAINILKEKGHEFLITTRDKEVTLDLLKQYGFDYVCTGKNKAGSLRKLLTMFRNDRVIYREAKKFKPDIFFSFFSPFAAQVGWAMKKPVIGFTDSEFAKLSIKLTRPFTNYIFTPSCFQTPFGEKHFRFNGYMESFYLQPSYFTPDPSVLNILGVEKDEPFYVMRFVSFNAGHDAGESGMDEQSKINIAEYLSSKGKLFISSESTLPEKFKAFKLPTSPKQFHDVLAFASLYVGEGVTTASECAQLGTPSILINTLRPGYIIEQEKLQLTYAFNKAADAFPVIKKLVETENVKDAFIKRRDEMLQTHIDCTNFLVELLDNFPSSIITHKKNRLNARNGLTLAISS
jgi:uncharacterized protein